MKLGHNEQLGTGHNFRYNRVRHNQVYVALHLVVCNVLISPSNVLDIVEFWLLIHKNLKFK